MKSSIWKNGLVELIERSLHNAGLPNISKNPKTHWAINIVTASFITVYVTQIIAMILALDDSEKLFECFSVLSFCGMGLLKLRSLRSNFTRWRYLLDQVTLLENRQLNTKDEANNGEDFFSHHINEYTENFRYTSTLLTRLYSTTAVVFMFSPFIEYVWGIIFEKGAEYPHILPVWSPLNYLGFIGYMATVSLEAVAAIYCVCVHIAFDLTTIGLMMFLCGQSASLRYYSESVGGSGEKLELSRARDARAQARIKVCHFNHVLLGKSTTELGELIKNILGVYFIVATLTLCSVAVQLNTGQLSVMQLVSLLQYMGATLTQLFLFCRYGDAVYHESSVGMGEGPYGAAYWCLNPSTLQELHLLAIGMTQPRRLRAGLFNDLDLPSFVQILRTAYSYYAVIRKD